MAPRVVQVVGDGRGVADEVVPQNTRLQPLASARTPTQVDEHGRIANGPNGGR